MSLDQLSSTDLLTDLWIGGKAVPATYGGRFDVLDPSTGQVLTTRWPPSTPPTPRPRPGPPPRPASARRSCAAPGSS
jgi:hypothetical protein